MSEHHDSTHATGEGASRIRLMRRGWFRYVAAFFIVLAGICFILGNNLNYQPGPLPTPVPPTTGK